MNPIKPDIIVDGVVLTYIDTPYGGYYSRLDGVKRENGKCLICGEPVKYISPNDFAAWVCFNHDPPLILQTPWCNPESVERRQITESEREFMERHGDG